MLQSYPFKGRPTALLLLYMLIAAPVGAVGTDPTLALTSSQAFAASSGVVAVTVAGAFNFDDLLQFNYPTGVVVSQASMFFRYGADGTVRQGNSATLSGGLNASEVPALLATGSAAAASARLVEVRSDRMTLTIPPGGLASGSATVVIYAVIDGEPFVSNAITVVLP